jgi:hypothetical protein
MLASILKIPTTVLGLDLWPSVGVPAARKSCEDNVMIRAMVRTGSYAAFLAVLSLASPGAAEAQDNPPDNDGRFTFHRTEDGYLRLDGRTGEVAACTRRPSGWICQLLPDERAALEAEIARLQGENSALKKELLSRNIPLPGGIKPDAPRTNEPRVKVPSDADLDRMMSFIEKMWKRLVEMIINTQKDMAKKS